MSEWWTYRLSNFLLFSPRTYYRLVERYNVAVWPAQLAALAIGLVLIVVLAGARGGRDRIVCGLLAACWLWVAWAFHYERYAQINWAATWFAAAFAAQALLVIVLGVVRRRIVFLPRGSLEIRIAISWIVIALFGFPLLPPLLGRSWMSLEIFGVMPEPTAIATIGILAAARGRIRWMLLAIPVIACTVAVATLWAMDSPEALIVFAAAAIPIVVASRIGTRLSG